MRIRVFMFGCFRHILPAAAGFFCVAGLWAGAGYLPRTGPVPLRFRPLPPPPTQTAAASAATAPRFSQFVPDFGGLPDGMNEGPGAPQAQAPLPAPATNAPAVEYRARDPVTTAVPATAPDPVVSAQMLMKYFISPSNSAPTGTVAPLGFMPPTVATPGPMPAPTAKAPNSTSP